MNGSMMKKKLLGDKNINSILLSMSLFTKIYLFLFFANIK